MTTALEQRIDEVLRRGTFPDAKAWCVAAGISHGYIGTLTSRLRAGTAKTGKGDKLLALATAAAVPVEWLMGTDEPRAKASRGRKPATLEERITRLEFEVARMQRSTRSLLEDVDAPDAKISLHEAAAIVGCSVSTLTDARRSGALVTHGRQGSRTVRRSELDAWVEARRVSPIAGVGDG